MPRFKQVQKVNTSLRLLTSGLACINFQWHLNASSNDPSRLLSGLLSSVCSCSRTDTTLGCDSRGGPNGLGMPAQEVQPRVGAGMDAAVERHHLPAQQNCARTWWRSWEIALLKQWRALLGCKSKTGRSVPYQQTPSWCQFPELHNFP